MIESVPASTHRRLDSEDDATVHRQTDSSCDGPITNSQDRGTPTAVTGTASAADDTRTRVVGGRACAKINLTLDILGRRGDGYHELRSLVVGVGVYDSIRCRSAASPRVELNCNNDSLSGADNLAVRAATALADHTGRDAATRIELEKRIPLAAGLGGGSSDAAAVLRLCNELWDTRLAADELARIGASLGSDVPLFFSLPAAVMTGRGERVRPVALRWSGWVLLVMVDVAVSTPDVYRAWGGIGEPSVSAGAIDALVDESSAAAMSPYLSNGLESAVFAVAPAVRNAFDSLNRAGLGPMRVSGAGSTLYRLFDDEQAARQAATEVTAAVRRVSTAVVAAPVAMDIERVGPGETHGARRPLRNGQR